MEEKLVALILDIKAHLLETIKLDSSRVLYLQIGDAVWQHAQERMEEICPTNANVGAYGTWELCMAEVSHFHGLTPIVVEGVDLDVDMNHLMIEIVECNGKVLGLKLEHINELIQIP